MYVTSIPEVDRPDLPPGKSWKCTECGATLRLNEHHSAGRHVVLFVDGTPTLYKDGLGPLEF
jgi:hypothetical protein